MGRPIATATGGEEIPDSFARVIRPIHTMLDGDTIFALSTAGEGRLVPEQTTDFQVTDMIGAAAADAMVLALIDAFMEADSIPGFPACRQVMAELGGPA